MQLIGVGKNTHNDNLDNWTEGNDTPICAEESPFIIWSDWNASQRDLFVVDMDGELALHQNITSGIPDDLDELIISLAETIANPCELGVVYVSEVHTSGEPEDYIEIYNSGDSDCSLEGFQLDDSEDLEDFTFGDVMIAADSYWVGYEDYENSFSSGLSSNGGIIVFADANNNMLAVTLEPSVELDSMELSQSFSENGVGCYTLPTPGSVNEGCITLHNKKIIDLPTSFVVHQNYPNPFNPSTMLTYYLPEDTFVNIKIYNMMGKIVNNLLNKRQNAGFKSIKWDAENEQGISLPAGVYLYRVETGDFRQTRKMILLK